MSEPSPGHLDLDALADAAAGLPDPTGHLADCASCTSRLSELAAAESRVTAALGALPAPALPDDVARRLAAALAAEPAPASVASASVTALPAPTARRRWLPAAAAAGVLVVSAAGLGLAFLPERGGDSADVSAAGAGAAGLPLSASGTDYADEAAVAQALPGVLAGGGAVLDGPDQARVESDGAAAGSSGDSSAESGATSLSAESDAMTAQAPVEDDPLARLRTPEGLADCLTALLPPDEPDVQPLALDYAQFAGAPALAVLLPDPDPGKVAVFVVGPGCTASDEDLRTFVRVDRA